MMVEDHFRRPDMIPNRLPPTTQICMYGISSAHTFGTANTHVVEQNNGTEVLLIVGI
jgi:hypothetical protein